MTNTTTHGQVPEALQPDTALLVARNCRETGSDPSCPFFARVQLMDAAYVLERLHAENATLQSGYDAARLEIDGLHARVQELEREAHSLRKDAERFRFANESEEDFAICYWDENMGNGGEWMCYGDKGDAIEVLDAAIRARGAQGDT